MHKMLICAEKNANLFTHFGGFFGLKLVLGTDNTQILIFMHYILIVDHTILIYAVKWAFPGFKWENKNAHEIQKIYVLFPQNTNLWPHNIILKNQFFYVMFRAL